MRKYFLTMHLKSKFSFGCPFIAAMLFVLIHLGQTAFAQPFSTYTEWEKVSFFEKTFSPSETVIPFPVANLKAHLENLSKVNDSDAELSPKLIYTMVPKGRSLQSAATDFSHPRILFGFIPSVDSPGSRQDYWDLVDRLFISYSEIQNKLEIISWNNFEGRFNFEEVRNYIPEKGTQQEFVKEDFPVIHSHTLRQTCTTCHQSGGPIYSDKPWSESSSSFGTHGQGISPIAQKIKDALKSEFYLGLEIDPKDAQGNRLLVGGRIHAVVKNAHASLLNARRIVRQSCGQSIVCRKELIKSILLLAQKGYYDDTDNLFFMMVPFRNNFVKYIDVSTLPAHHFSYPSHTIPNFNPLAAPGPIAPEINPSAPRDFIDGLFAQPARPLEELVATQSLIRGYEGLGLLKSDIEAIKKCDEENMETIFKSEAFIQICQNWHLNDSDQDPIDKEPLYFSIKNLVSANCKEE
jgi:hypothetical protein